MKLFQPPPVLDSSIKVQAHDIVSCEVPLFFVRHRYAHHAAASGYDRLCDYVGETLRVPRNLYLSGETWLRPYCLLQARYGGHYEYSRYDCVMEIEAMRHYRMHHNSVYHFIYAEKSFKRMASIAGKNNNLLIGTVHHPPEHSQWLFRSMSHFRAFDHLLVMSEDQVRFWQTITGRNNVSFMPHGIDTSYFTPGSRPNQGPVRCIFIGSHERDLQALSFIVRRISSSHPTVQFDLLSSDPICTILAAEFSNVHCHLRISDADYLQLLRNADLMILPLQRSTACNAVLEALACGVPIVTNTGGIDSYLSPDCSVSVPIGDLEAFEDALTMWINNDQLRLRAAEAARRHALSLSWPSVAQRLSYLCEGLMEEKLGHGR